MLPSILIVDDFLKDPETARRLAQGLTYDRSRSSGNYIGVTSAEPFEIKDLDNTVSRLIGMPVCGAPNTLHQHCRLALTSDKGRSGVHVDPADYSGILYLSHGEDAKGGTDFYRHKRTGLDRVPTTLKGLQDSGYSDPNQLIEDVINKDTTLPAKWERVMRVPMRFNRLILFSPWLFHNAGPGFGETIENGRLVSLMFFVRKIANG